MAVAQAREKLEEDIGHLEAEISRLSAALADAKALISALNNPRYSSLFANGTTIGNKATHAKTPTSKASKSEPGTFRDRIIAAFKKNGNAWRSAREIMDDTGIDRGIINNILYVSYKDEFEPKPHPTLKRRTLWRMIE